MKFQISFTRDPGANQLINCDARSTSELDMLLYVYVSIWNKTAYIKSIQKRKTVENLGTLVITMTKF